MGVVLQNFKHRVIIERHPNPGGFNLIIQSVTANDAGKYVCKEEGENGQYSVAELVVLDETPVCESNISEGVIGTSNCGLEPDETVELLCQATYHGNIPPIIKWEKDGNDLSITQTNYPDYVSSQLSVNLTSNSHELNFICHTARSTVEQYRCSKPVTVLSASNNFLTAEKKEGDEATCSVNGSIQCTYRWIRSDNGHEDMVSNNQNISLSRSGLYRCEAECMIKGKRCLLVAGQVKVASAAHEESKVLLAISVIFLVVGIAMCLLFASLWLYKRKKSRDQMNKNDVKFFFEDDENSPLLHSDESTQTTGYGLRFNESTQTTGYGLRLINITTKWMIMVDDSPTVSIRSFNIKDYDLHVKTPNFEKQRAVEDFISRDHVVKNGVELYSSGKSDADTINEISKLNTARKLTRLWSTGKFELELK